MQSYSQLQCRQEEGQLWVEITRRNGTIGWDLVNELLEVVDNHAGDNIRNRVPEETEEAVVALGWEDPSLGQKRASDELPRQGIFISPAGVRCG